MKENTIYTKFNCDLDGACFDTLVMVLKGMHIQ